MTIHPARDRVQLGSAAELATSPRVVVELGRAPDGLPWLVRADRSRELEMLFHVVPQVFGLSRREDLPARVRDALEKDVAAGLMGVHEVDLDGKPRRAFVSRKKLKQLLGPTLFSQLLERHYPQVPSHELGDRGAITNIGAIATPDDDVKLLEAVDKAIDSLRAKRHLLLDLGGSQAYSCSVRETDRALRVPSAPIRPLAFESLAACGGVTITLGAPTGSWTVPLTERDSLQAALTRVYQSGSPGWTRYHVPRHELLVQLVSVARSVDQLHRKERIHADLAPGNLLITEGGARAFDGLDVEAGEKAVAATFEWAAPEQIVGHPLDPRTDVYALGRIAAQILEGVVFGEQTVYIVPIGNGDSRRVELLKAEGVFIDITGTTHDRSWQRAWQDLLGRAVSYDRTKRPASAGHFADELQFVLSRHAVPATLDLSPMFGDIVGVEGAGGITFAHVVTD